MQQQVPMDQIITLSKKCNISEPLARHFLISSANDQRKAEKKYEECQKSLPTILKEYEGLTKQNEITGDDFIKLFHQLGIMEDDYLQLYFTMKCRAFKKFRFTKDEFVIGMLRLKCKTLKELKAKVPELRKKIKTKALEYKIYANFFMVISEGRNTIYFSDAIVLWETLLKSIFQINDFVNFCNALPNDFKSNTRISFDVYKQVWKFNEVVGRNLDKFDENEAWPVLIWDFIDFQKKIK